MLQDENKSYQKFPNCLMNVFSSRRIEFSTDYTDWQDMIIAYNEFRRLLPDNELCLTNLYLS